VSTFFQQFSDLTTAEGLVHLKCERSRLYNFLRHFERHTREYAEFLKVYKGNITKRPDRDARAIGVPSTDVAKNANLMLHCAREFFPRLIPGQSVIVHQDYIFAFDPRLDIAMELMANLVEKVYDVANHYAMVFAPKRAITAEEVEARLGHSGADYYDLGNVRYLYQAIEKSRPGFGRWIHTVVLASFYAMMGQRKTAIQVALRMLEEYGPSVAVIEAAALGPFPKDTLGIDYRARLR
jgi:hypothetical protein